MSPAQLKNLVRRKTRTNTNSYSDADLLADLNLSIYEIAGRIQQERPEIWNMPATANLVANQREYGFPGEIINNMVSLEVMFDPAGDTDKDYKVATALKRVPVMPISEDNIVGEYSNDEPYYFIRRQAIYILSGAIVAVTNGIKLVYNLFPASITNINSETDLSVDPTTTSHGFPKEFHELLARRTAIHFKDIKGMKLNREDQLYEQDLERKLSEFSRTDQSLAEIAQVPSSESLGFHGYNY